MRALGALVTFAGAGHLVCSLFSAAARLSVVALCVLYRKSSVTSARAAAASPRSVAATNDSTSCVGVTVLLFCCPAVLYAVLLLDMLNICSILYTVISK